MSQAGTVRASRRALLAAFVSIALATAGGAAFLMRQAWREGRARAGVSLEAVAALKARFLSAWLVERLQDAAIGASYPSVARCAASLESCRADDALLRHIAEVLELHARQRGYHHVWTLDAAGAEIQAWSSPSAEPVSVDPDLLRRARLAGRGVALLAPPGSPRPRVQVAASVAPSSSGALVVLDGDLAAIYDDAIQAWPLPSSSGQTGLVRRDGDRAYIFTGAGVFARGRTHDTVPLSRTEVPAVRALAGAAGVFEAVDSRGVPVLAAARPVAGTSWILVSKMDLAEIDAPLYRPFAVILALLAALLGVGGLLLAFWWRHDSARAHIEEALRESREVFQLALAGSHVVWDWDLDAGRLRIERDWSETTGRPRRVVEGGVELVASRLVHPADREAALAQLEAHLRGETPRFAMEFRRAEDRDGPERWYFVRGRGSRRDAQGRAHRITGVVSDVTARRDMQAQLEQAERLASVGSLAAAVAHEINNPLAYVLANLGFLGTRISPERAPEEAEALGDARDGAERVRDVVRGLRTFSRPGAGPRAAVDVAAEIAAALRITQNEIRHRARLVQRIGPLPQVLAGSHELGQLFVNLLVNAAHAIPAGRAQENAITVEACTDPAGWARVEVQDTGVGMAPQVLRRVFDPFFTTKPGGKGMGLGMVIARGIVDGAGGRIEVESEVGHGTVVRVLLPPAPAVAREVEAPGNGSGAPPRRRVLLVDDDPLVARSVVRALGQAHDVVTTHSGAEALARLEAGARFDAVLCDVMMPEMTGAQLHARVEARDPELARRFVFLTGGAFTDEAMEFLRRVACPCLDKPFDAEQLRRALEWAGRGPEAPAPRMTPPPWRPEKPTA